MSGSPSAWLPGGDLPTDGPQSSSPWTDPGPTGTAWRNHESDHLLGYEGYLASAVYLTLTGMIAIAGNVIAVVVFLSEKEFRKKEHNSFVLNLATADLGVSILGYPASTISGYAGRWVFGDVGCTMYGFFCFTFSAVSMVTLCAISVYRYIVICKPQYAHLLTHSRTKYVIIGIWLYVLIFTVPPLAGVSRFTYEPIHISCSLDWNVQYPGEMAYIAMVIMTFYVLKVSIMCFCYFNIIFKSVNLKFAALASDKARRAAKRDIWKTSLMCLAMVVSFLIAWTPYAVSSAWNILSQDDLPVLAAVLPTMFAKSSCMMNPLIYTCSSKTFRQAALKSFRRLGRRGSQTVPVNTIQVASLKSSREAHAMVVLPPVTNV